MTEICPGCGAKLQNNNPLALGYVPKNVKTETIYCERCFKIVHYNMPLAVSAPADAELLIDTVNKNGQFVFFLVDFLNINTEIIATFLQIKISKCLVISKCDIIPKSIKEEKIILWLKDVYDIRSKIIFTSSLKAKNLSKISQTMLENKISKAYVLGYTNAGKSSLINKLFERFQEQKSLITISNLPNTTLDFINIEIDKSFSLIDSPGFVLKTDVYKNIEMIKKANPRKFIKPITYPLKKGDSIVISEIFRLEYTSDEKNNMTFYLSNQLELKKIFSGNPFLTESLHKEYKISADTDIVIKGLGFINVKKPCKIRIYSEYIDLIEIRKSMF